MWRRGEIRVAWVEMTKSGNGSIFDRGAQTRLAEKLGVSRATISRDIAAIKEGWGCSPCPTCGGMVQLDRWPDLERQGKVEVRSP